MNNQAGKGDAERVRNFKDFRSNFDRIFSKDKDEVQEVETSAHPIKPEPETKDE